MTKCFHLSLLIAMGLNFGLECTAQQVDQEALARNAVEAERRGDFAAAVSGFTQLIQQGVDGPEIRTNLGIAYFQLQNFSGALREFRSALAKQPNSLPANLFSGLSLISLQRPSEAIAYLEKARRLQPQDASVTLALARAEIASNNISAARSFYEQSTRLDPNNAEGWYGLGITLRVLAEQNLRNPNQHQNTPSQADAHARASKALLNQSEPAMATALRLDPESVRARMILGESFRIAERYDLAVKEYEGATRQQPQLAAAWAGLAAAYSASGDDQKALTAASRAVQLDPGDAETIALIAGTYLRLGDYDKAELYARKALSLQPDLSSARIAMAKIYLQRQQPEKALPELQFAVKDDRDGATYYLLATALRQVGNVNDAAAAMRKYKELHASHLRVASNPSRQ